MGQEAVPGFARPACGPHRGLLPFSRRSGPFSFGARRAPRAGQLVAVSSAASSAPVSGQLRRAASPSGRPGSSGATGERARRTRG